LGNARYYIGHFDLTNILALGGNGVDLFFVISGFCMYYFYAAKHKFSYRDFYRFLVKRWVRLSPAFYTATVVYLLIRIFISQDINVNAASLFTSVFYLNSIFPRDTAASHFWTLGVEWQFYLVIPFLLIYQNRIGFKKIFVIIFGLLFLVAIVSVLVIRNRFDLITDQIFFRGIEFGCGTVAGRLLLINNIAYFKSRALWLLTFIVITYAGRVMISNPVLSLSANYNNLFKLSGFTLMGAGFSGILYLAVTSAKWLNLILGNILFKTMGKISYSFYLWHPLVIPVVNHYTLIYMPFAKGITAPVLSTCISAIILYPISILSYNMLEKPFLSVGNLTTK